MLVSRAQILLRAAPYDALPLIRSIPNLHEMKSLPFVLAALLAAAPGAGAAHTVTIPLAGVSITNGASVSRSSAPAALDAALRYRAVTAGTVSGTPNFSVLWLLFPTPVPLDQALTTLTGSTPDLDTVLGNPPGTLPVGGTPQVFSGSSVVAGQTVTVSATLTVSIDASGVASFTADSVTITPAAIGGLKFATGQVTVSTISCLADLNFDGVVDDADFSLFVADYNALIIASPQTGGDFNGDGQCDDADFQFFAVAYDSLVCP